MTDLCLSQLYLLVCAAVLVWRCEPAVNLMGSSRQTPMTIRAPFLLLLAAGLVAVVAVLFYDYRPGVVDLLVFSGVALLLLCERRMRVLLPPACVRERRRPC